MDKKYQIFISSTYIDLKEARAKVRDAILAISHFPVGMEYFGAANEEQWQIIRNTIDSSDYYVLIIGHRYGSVIPDGMPDSGMSYTEKEFRYAAEKGIPILAFIIDDDVPVNLKYIEDENPDKLRTFKETVKNGRMVEWWKTDEELARKVTTALHNQIIRTKRPGWIRADKIDIEELVQSHLNLNKRYQQLVEEIENLRLENENLKQKESSKKPNLIISLEGDDGGEKGKEDSFYSRKENIITDNEGNIHLKVGSIDICEIEREYSPLKQSDFFRELHGKVTDEEIKEYNDSLPSAQEIKKYIALYRNYYMMNEYGIATIVNIHNNGKTKASDVSAIIEFPEQIKVLTIKDAKNMEEPKPLEKPRSLLDVAYERTHRSEIMMAKAMERMEPYLGLNDIISPNIPFKKIVNTANDFVNIKENIVYLDVKNGIVHTKYDSLRGLYIVPMEKGVFKAKVSLMCAEYEEPEETEFTFICE